MGKRILTKFGKYILLDQIGQGGMAEIFRARPAKLDANGRVIVIKRIHSHVTHEDEFLRMFKSEIQVCMGFNHPNTVQIYDFGDYLQQPYIAMEYVEGINLRQLIMKFADINQKIPIEMAVHIIEQAAAGLHYAHTFENRATGHPLKLIHRDISPQNILLSYDGNAKVIDFGIAKSMVKQEDQTQFGVIKGKVSYLSPEQMTGQVLDARSDIFSLGIVLWELLTCEKLFVHSDVVRTDSGSLLSKNFKISGGLLKEMLLIKPPSALNPTVPLELNNIVLKALAKGKEHRFQTAEEFGQALHQFLASYRPSYTTTFAADILKNLLKSEIDESRRSLHELNELAQTSLLTDETQLSNAGEVKEIHDSGKIRDIQTPYPPYPMGTAPMAAQMGAMSNVVGVNSASMSAVMRPAEIRRRFPIAISPTKMGGMFVYLMSIVFLRLDLKYDLVSRILGPPEIVPIESKTIELASSDPPVYLQLDMNSRKQLESKSGNSVKFLLNKKQINPDIPFAVPLDRVFSLSVQDGASTILQKQFFLKSSLYAKARNRIIPISLEP